MWPCELNFLAKNIRCVGCDYPEEKVIHCMVLGRKAVWESVTSTSQTVCSSSILSTFYSNTEEKIW